MRVQELLANIKNKEFKLNKGIETKTYIPMDVKKTIAQSIIYECTSNEDGAIKVDSVQRYMAYVRYMITTHTNLEYTDDNYDVLCSTEYHDTTLLNAIVDTFRADANECNRILDLMMDDFLQDNSMECSVARFLHDLNNSLGGIVGSIGSKIGELQALQDGFNINNLTDVLKIYNQN